ncbi:acyl-CoA thioester hydrolase/BAAT C-terminal domain-containing protein [Myxococcus sp. CA039A]|uniref:alpha/beta hydrolase family protein n=1 Tax=Myxococcus sp. CA039A TaxID=2741737 RepID=UPI00157B224D|nr:dienelactone hydrolase family protein [Myxococcus sp. CA039A]NTX53608.1 dienelactone hydrolase family protein [Myxococcus sp. CA039A]
MTRYRPAPRYLVLLLALLTIPSARAEQEPAAATLLGELRSVTDYDAKAPLDVKTVRAQRRGDITVTELTYASPKGGRVPAYLVTPPGPGPFAGLTFLHWGQGSKNEFLDEALSLARSGVVSLLVDAPHVRPAPWRGSLKGAAIYDSSLQMLVDMRRAVDLLASRPEVDARRLGFVGHSMGAMVGGALAGVEPRLRAFVLMNGVGDYSKSIREMELDNEKQLANAMSKEDFAKLVRKMAVLDGVVGVGHAAPRALFFQNGRSDAWVTAAQVNTFIDAATMPKLAKVYEGGHELGDAARRDRAQWLRTHLGFGEVPAFGPPMIALPMPPELQGLPLPEWTKARPVLTIPGMEEVQVRRALTYTRAGGRDYKLDLYIPEAVSQGRVPIIVLAHGLLHPDLTPLVRDLPAFAGQARWLATQGFAVALVELGSPSTGIEKSQWLTRVADLQKRVDAALAFVRKQAATEPLDADRVCLMAMSAGGLWGLSPALSKAPPAWLRCAVAWYPLLGGPDVPRGLGPMDGLKAANAKKVPPLLVLRAGLDTPPLNAALDDFVKEARSRGAPLTLMELPEGHHGFELTDDVEDSREAMRKTALFFEEHLLP